MLPFAIKRYLGWLMISAAICGCAGTGERRINTEGRALLDRLKSGMSREQVIAILGEPSTFSEIRPSRFSMPSQQLTYVNTVVNPGVVELYFQPGLVEIHLDAVLYRDLSPDAPTPVSPAGK